MDDIVISGFTWTVICTTCLDRVAQAAILPATSAESCPNCVGVSSGTAKALSYLLPLIEE